MNLKDAIERFMEALIKRVEGSKDIRKKLDYLMKPDYIETSSILSSNQVDAVATMIQLGDMYPTLEPLKSFARLFATWTPSTDGKARDQLERVMMQVAPEQPPNVTTINTGGSKGGEETENK